MPIPDELRAQAEAAFDFRGHVTLAFHDGRTEEGFVSNRDFAKGLIQFWPKGAGAMRDVPLADLRSIELTGEDHAESYAEGLKRTEGSRLEDA